MYHFPVLRTKRLTLQLKELSIGDSIRLALMPEHLKESSCTVFINSAIDSVEGEENPLLWTAQERILAVAHYLSVVSDDGPNYSLGNDAHYLDYLDIETDISKALNQCDVGMVAGENWVFTHLTGGMLEAIERLAGELPGMPKNMYWIIGSMAAQMLIKDRAPKSSLEGDYDEYLLQQMNIINALPESEFQKLLNAYYQGREKLHHHLSIDFNADGLIVLPKEGDGNLPPATFPVHTCLSQYVKYMVNQYGGNDD